MFIGIIYAVIACLLWGLIVVIPKMILSFSPLEITLGRYFFYGLTSLLFVLCSKGSRFRGWSLRIWGMALFIAFACYIVYYLGVLVGLRYASSTITALILGLAPITVSFYGNWVQKECSFSRLVLPAVLIGIGLVITNVVELFWSPHHASIQYGEYAFGIAGACLAIALWTWYAVANARFLQRHPEISAGNWASLIGVGTLLCSIVLAISLGLFTDTFSDISHYSWGRVDFRWFLGGCFVLGGGCAWLGALLWNHASTRLPMSLGGQLLVLESLFGLVFLYILDQRTPSLLELIGIACIIIGVVAGIRAFHTRSLAPKLQQKST